MNGRLKDNIGCALHDNVLSKTDIDRPMSTELPSQTQAEHGSRLPKRIERTVQQCRVAVDLRNKSPLLIEMPLSGEPTKPKPILLLWPH